MNIESVIARARADGMDVGITGPSDDPLTSFWRNGKLLASFDVCRNGRASIRGPEFGVFSDLQSAISRLEKILFPACKELEATR